jgi:fibronectin type 3 domain-containing protein
MRTRILILCAVIALLAGNANVASATDLRDEVVSRDYSSISLTTKQDQIPGKSIGVDLQNLHPLDEVTESYQYNSSKTTREASSDQFKSNIGRLTAIFLAGDDPELGKQVIDLIREKGGRVVHIILPRLLLAELDPSKFAIITAHPNVLNVRQNTVDDAKAEGLEIQSARIWNGLLAPKAPEPLLEPSQFESSPIIAESPEPPANRTSEFLIGTVIVSAIHPYCDGSGGTCYETRFTESELDGIMTNVVTAMDWWADEEPDANLVFIYEPIQAVGIPTEPSWCHQQPSSICSDTQWYGETMEELGFPGTNSFTQMREYVHDLRQSEGADWGLIVYVPKSTSTLRSYAYYGGPCQVDWNGSSAAIIAHETGHNFHALDEYSTVSRWPWMPTFRRGYLGRVVSGNRRYGFVDEPSIMIGGMGGVSTYVRGAIGWSDSDGTLPTDWGSDVGPVSENPYRHVISSDFNKDEYPDLAFVDCEVNEILIWLNDGSGGWVERGSFEIDTCASDLTAIGLYMLTTTSGQFGASLIVAESGGPIRTFSNICWPVGDCTPSWTEKPIVDIDADIIAVGDVDQDDELDLDLIAGLSSGGISIFTWSSSSSTWSPFSAPSSSDHFTAFDMGDFNEDSHPDIVGASDLSGGLHLWLGDGTGTWTDLITLEPTISFHDVWASDVNGDEHFDLIASKDPGGVLMWTGDGTGSFESYTAPTPGTGRQIWMADFDHDLDLDLVMATGTNGIKVILHDESGTWSLGAAVGGGTNYQAGLAVADFNRDGFPDIAGSSETGNKVSVWLNPGLEGDHLLDLVDTYPESSLASCPATIYERTHTFNGTASDIPVERGSLGPPGPDISINTIQTVEYRVDGGAWSTATAVDGTFDEGEEAFTFDVGPLSNGPHTIEVQSENVAPNTSVGNTEETPEECQLTVSPPLPPSIQASDGTYTDKVRVTWDPVSGATSYDVYRSLTETSAKMWIGSPTGTSFDETTAAAGALFYYWAKACGDTGCSDYSTYDTGWRRPLAPENVAASDGTFTDKVQVAWDPVSDAIFYELYRAASEAGAKTLIGSPTGLSLDDTTADPGTLYYYWVKACGDSYCSDYSAYDTGWRRPLAPENVTASDGTSTDWVQVTWNSVIGATSYKVYRAESATGSKTQIGNPTTASFNDTTAVPGTFYYFWVKTCIDGYCSDYSTYNTGWRDLSEPENVEASDGSFTDKVQISWDAVSGATSYGVYRATTAGGTKTLIGSPTDEYFNDTTAVAGTLYYYWVEACADTGCSDLSAYDPGWRRPLAPENVAASDGTSPDSVWIDWDAVSGATSYEVYRATSDVGVKTLIGSPTDEYFDDTTAVAGTLYYYWVKACVDSYCSDYSVYDTGWPRPPEPVNVQASDGTFTDKVRVTWDAVSGVTNYEVHRSTSEGGVKTLLGSPTGTSFDDSTADAGELYYYWVKACNGPRCSVFSDYDTGWQKPLPPESVQASDGTSTDEVQITWDSSTGATSYKVYRAVSLVGTKTFRGSTSGTTFNDTSGVPGMIYYYWVRACNGSRCSDYSAYDTGWIKPTPPSSIQASDGSYEDKVRVYWSTSWGATSYEVYRATSVGGTKTKIGSPSGTVYDDATAFPGTTYYYWVKACNGPRCSDFSSHDTGWRRPPEPENLQASDGTFEDKVRISWDAVSVATSYEVYRAESEGGTKTLIRSPTGTSFDDSTALAGTLYYYWVKACVNVNCSDFSVHDTGWRRPLAPENVAASDGTFEDKVQISWDAVSEATSYEVYRAISESGTKILIGSPTDTSFNDSTALAGTLYYYWVKACNGPRCSDFSTHDTGWSRPLAPENVQASDGTFEDKVQINWDAVSEATSYGVYRATSETGAKTLIGSPTGTSFDDTTAVPGLLYYYWVEACVKSYCSDFSAHDTGWSKPPEPENVQASDGIFTDKVLINWDEVSVATSYEVYRAESEAGAKTLIGSPTDTSFNDTTAVPGTLYYYWVKACNGPRCSDFSTHDTGWSRPLAPENVEASDGTFMDKIQITWDSSTGATSYNIHRAESLIGIKTKIATVSGTSYDDTSADYIDIYYYWVEACNGPLCSDFSTHDTGWRKPPKPVKPTNVKASDGTFTAKVQITWSSSLYATSYRVFRSTTPTGAKVYLGNSIGTSYDDTTASRGKAYYYRVKACNISGCSHLGAYDKGWRKTKKSFRSIPNHDGWVLESRETSNRGGRTDNTQTTLRIGDDPLDRQYCSIISFNTKVLPDGAVITSAILKIRKVRVVGTDPFTTHGALWAAIRKGYFGTSPALQSSDFQAPASASFAAKVVLIPSTNWYRAKLKSSKLVFIDLAGFTQFRLCFSLDDNDDGSSDFIKFLSGNVANKTARPKLEVFYYVP